MSHESDERRQSDPLGQRGMYLGDHVPPPTTGPASHDPFAFPPPVPSAAPPAAYPQTIPYPVQPPVLGAARSDKNWKGIVSVVLGALGGGLIGLGLGLSGMSDAKKGLATNRTVALWGVILNIAVPVLVIGAFVVASLITGPLDENRVVVEDIAVGECILMPDASDSGELSSEYVDRVPCTEPHWGQVYVRDYYRDPSYPGDDAMLAAVDAVCNDLKSIERIDPVLGDGWYYGSFMPTRESFTMGDRRLVCLVTDADGSLVGDFVVD